MLLRYLIEPKDCFSPEARCHSRNLLRDCISAPLERGEPALISQTELDYIHCSWGVGRVPAAELQAEPCPDSLA